MAVLPRVRQIEETLRQAGLDPRLISVVCSIAERQRVQHQQIMMLAENFGKMQDLMKDMLDKLGVRDANLRKLGVEEMIKGQRGGVSVESVEEFDQQVKPTGEH